MAEKKPLFLLERDIIAARAEYHEYMQQDTRSAKQEAKLSDKVKELQDEMSNRITDGAKASKDQQLLGIKKRDGLFEIIDIAPADSSGKRARGGSPEEVVYKWNEGEFYVKPEGDELPIGKAEPVPAEAKSEDEE